MAFTPGKKGVNPFAKKGAAAKKAPAKKANPFAKKTAAKKAAPKKKTASKKAC